ncbi:MAG: hypothetical protein JNK65_02650 [Deltaproteobacteria bacterium]|nr:hypothetical protein [Deltaproteobacteria bacterium]
MSFGLEGIIASAGVLKEHEKDYLNIKVFSLHQGLEMIPVTVELFEEMSGAEKEQYDPEFDPLFGAATEKMEEWFLKLSEKSKILYFEVWAFSGEVYHAATVWEKGQKIFGREHSCSYTFASDEKTALNDALRLMGVQKEKSDEFDALQLGRYRYTEQWV